MKAYWAYFHQLDPFIIQFSDNFGLRWYSMAYIVAFIAGYYLVLRWLIRSKKSPLSQKQWADLLIWAAVGMILGGRLGYAVFYSPGLLTEWGGSFPYWGLLKIHEGGLASHGGILGLLTAVIVFSKRQHLKIWHNLDLLSLTAGLGIFLGRCANFINGELYGRVIKGKVLLAVQFPQEILEWAFERKTEHLKQLAGAVAALKNYSAEQWTNWIYQAEASGSLTGRIYQAIYLLIEECSRKNQEVIAALSPVLPFRHPSQIYQGVLEGLLPFAAVWLFWRKKPRQPGLVFVFFGLSYCLMRIVGEQFRMPDMQLGFRTWDLTRGQWLSLITLAGFLFCLIKILKAPTNKKWGGWAA